MNIFNKKTKFLEREIEKLWYNLAEKEKEINALKIGQNYNELEIEIRMIILKLRAIIDYLDIEFKEEWVEDCSYLPLEPRKIRRLKAQKINRKE